MKTNYKRFALLAAFSSILAIVPASAQNTFYAPGDLVLYFQQQGGLDTIYANLGNTATFRGTAAGAADGTNVYNITNLSTTLVSAFGAGWASDPSVFAGLAGVWGTSNTSTTLQNGDPHRTVYVSRGRNDISGDLGTVGAANSTVWNITTGGSGASSSASSGILAQNQPFEANFNAAVAISPTSQSGIDNQNPISGPGLQGTAFGTFSGGVQQRGQTTSFGAFDAVSSSEFALDLYRILGRNDVSGQVAGTTRVGSYEGTVLVGSDGNVSFVAVPEPSGALALGLLGTVAGLGYRRRKA